MKAFCLISSWLLLSSCARTSRPDPRSATPEGTRQPVTIDFQTGFQGRAVELRLNGQRVFAGVLTTDERIGLARSLEYAGPLPDRIEAEFIVAAETTNRFKINLKRGRYIGFYEDLDTGKIHMDISPKPFLYD